jgi:hypothetical protein
VPDWQQAAQAGKRLYGSGPTNKAQIERIEEQLKVRDRDVSMPRTCKPMQQHADVWNVYAIWPAAGDPDVLCLPLSNTC